MFMHFGLIELPFLRMPNTYFFILCLKAVMVNFARGGDQVPTTSRSQLMTQKAFLCPWFSVALFTLSLQAFCGECCRGRDLRCGGR